MVAYISIETALRIVETAYLTSAILMVGAAYIGGNLMEAWEKERGFGKSQP